ncbi:MAG: DUF2188 domain-containing protein [Winogradskyella sp.]|uniref:DUF2188 domain-containing protein n=1 Tax=Winogradskyella sp. TaxID=1883156 RepID=UPI000F3DE0C4|nr:DUF2188 domain-containing protein [Winogradskyella sp.]RNC88021.1 MAG: DUF2188 domain-containing protein [Winogradskyella sp.]
MATENKTSWAKALLEIFQVILKAFSKSNTKRTWHQHVVPYEDGWAVRREGNKRITSKHRKQSTAINKAKSIAKRILRRRSVTKVDVIIHRESGGIRDRISFKD